tara:strand:- start:53 stop:913 length:861 start_codon:yes stop_codon:yes gene_type:complete
MARKKGRKPKAKIYNNNEINQITNNECLIAHIPLTLDKINNYNNKQNNIINNKNYNDNIKTKIKSDLFIENNNTNISTNNSEKDLLNKIKILENKIFEIQEQNNNVINYNYSSVNLYDNIKQNNNNLCWWCCHKFNNLPIYLPERKQDNNYYVYGYFCSFNCALSYNIELDDYKVWERTSLLNQLYYDLTKQINKIYPAPHKYMLKAFGGKLTIEEFRNKSLYINKSYRFIIPPLKSIIPNIEEKNNNNNSCNIISNDNNDLVLRRSKPLVRTVNSIEKVMNLQLH